jgi:hypothetical protein
MKDAHKQMLGPDKGVPKPGGLFSRQIDHALGARRQPLQRLLTRFSAPHNLNAFFSQGGACDPVFRQLNGSHASGFPYKTQQQMLGPDIAVPKLGGGLMRQLDNGIGALCEFIAHCFSPIRAGYGMCADPYVSDSRSISARASSLSA